MHSLEWQASLINPYYIIAPSCDCRESYTKSMPTEVNLYRCLSLLRKVRPAAACALPGKLSQDIFARQTKIARYAPFDAMLPTHPAQAQMQPAAAQQLAASCPPMQMLPCMHPMLPRQVPQTQPVQHTAVPLLFPPHTPANAASTRNPSVARNPPMQRMMTHPPQLSQQQLLATGVCATLQPSNLHASMCATLPTSKPQSAQIIYVPVPVPVPTNPTEDENMRDPKPNSAARRKRESSYAGTAGRVPTEAGPGIAHTDDGRVAGEARRKGLEAHQVHQRGSIARQSGSRTGTKGGRSGTKSKTKQRKKNGLGGRKTRTTYP